MNQFTISLDFEIGWGSIENDIWRRRQAAGVYQDLREVLPEFLSALDTYEISLTWATVGAMVSQPTKADFEHLPQAIKEKTARFLDEAAPETQDGRDLLEMVQATRTPQEIGCHTFSHCRWSIPEFDAAARQKDTELAVQALGAWGVVPKSFVYPLNHFDNLEILRDAGFEIARTAPPRPGSRFGKVIEMASGRTPQSKLELRPDGLTSETGSLLYVWGIRSDWRLRRAAIRRQVNIGLERAARGDGDFHIWLHPFNLAETPFLMQDVLVLLKKAARMRDEGKISITTMQQRILRS